MSAVASRQPLQRADVREQVVPEWAKPPLFDRWVELTRYGVASLRHPALRGNRMRLGRGAELMLAPSAEIDIDQGFRARRDLTLVVQGKLSIGSSMFCNRSVLIAAMHRITIGSDVRAAERVSILDHNHVIEPLDDLRHRFDSYTVAPVTIGDRVLISANCVVLAGATIGDDSVVAAGSVVRGEIPPGVLAAGAPAVVKRELRLSDRTV